MTEFTGSPWRGAHDCDHSTTPLLEKTVTRSSIRKATQWLPESNANTRRASARVPVAGREREARG
jgi:hypothetical protein